MKTTFGLLASAALLSMGTSANAFLVTGFTDTDLNTRPDDPPFVADFDGFDDTLYGFAVTLGADVAEGTLYEWTITLEDITQIGDIAPVSQFLGSTVLDDGPVLRYSWNGGGSAGDTLFTYEVLTADLDFKPDDEEPDIEFSFVEGALGFLDEANGGIIVNDLDVDFQAVPVPASVFLLGGAVAGLGALRRRAKKAT